MWLRFEDRSTSTEDFATYPAAGSLGSMVHTYAEEGTYTASVTVIDEAGNSDSKSFNVTVQDAALSATGVNAAATEARFTGAVATFSDAESSAGSAGRLHGHDHLGRWQHDLPARSAISRQSGASGVFTVSGMHTYAEEGRLRGVGVDRRERQRCGDAQRGHAVTRSAATAAAPRPRCRTRSLSATGVNVAATEAALHPGCGGHLQLTPAHPAA